MRITVWYGNKIYGEVDFPEAPGPDIQLDPWADKLHVVGSGKTGLRGQVITYRGGLMPRVNAPEPRRPRRASDGLCVGCGSPPETEHGENCDEGGL